MFYLPSCCYRLLLIHLAQEFSFSIDEAVSYAISTQSGAVGAQWTHFMWVWLENL